MNFLTKYRNIFENSGFLLCFFSCSLRDLRRLPFDSLNPLIVPKF